jgi:hypothetical protein
MKNIVNISFLILLFTCLSFWLQAQEINTDSIATKQKQFAQKLDSITQQKINYPKNLLKIQWVYNRPNDPWVLPSGIRYERILGRHTTTEIGFSFVTRGGDLKEYAIYGEARYYFRKAKKHHTFKGFFVRGGLVYQYQKVLNFSIGNPTSTDLGYRKTAGFLGGIGYQAIFLKKFSFEATFGTSAGYYATDWQNTEKLDAFRWNEIALKLGYAF